MNLTIITSLYKSERFLPSFIKNVKRVHSDLKKEGVSFEHILISNDINEKEKAQLQKLGIENISIVQVPRETLYATWNRGVSLAKGDVVTFWNVDDTRNGEAIKEGVRELQSSNKDLAYFPFLYKRYIKVLGISILVKIKKVIPPHFDKVEFGQSMHCGPFFMFKKTLFERVGKFDESFTIAGDFDWCVRASKSSDFKRINILAGTFHNDGRSLSGSRSETHKDELKTIYKKYGINK